MIGRAALAGLAAVACSVSGVSTDATDGCPDGESRPCRASDSAYGDALDAPAALEWRDLGAYAIEEDGLTAEVEVDVPPGARPVMVRARAGVGLPDTVCFGFADVTTPSGVVLPSRQAFLGADGSLPLDEPGYALGVWPRLGDPPAVAGTWRVRAAGVACGSGAPIGRDVEGEDRPTIRLESAALPGLGAETPRLRVVPVFAPGVDPTHWGEAFETAREIVARAELAVAIQPAVTLSPPLPPLNPLLVGLGLEDVHLLSQAIDLQATPRDDDALVVLVPCIDRVAPGAATLRLAGHSTRLPGGPRLAGWASLVVVGATDCGPLAATDAPRLGHVIAHELGHLLGLPHALEPGLMAAALSEPTDFTAAEAAAMRASPLVTVARALAAL